MGVSIDRNPIFSTSNDKRGGGVNWKCRDFHYSEVFAKAEEEELPSRRLPDTPSSARDPSSSTISGRNGWLGPAAKKMRKTSRQRSVAPTRPNTPSARYSGTMSPELVRAGHTAERACDLIYEAYGSSLAVTEIIRRMRTDRKNNCWPDQISVRQF
jgi:hypothetical protein